MLCQDFGSRIGARLDHIEMDAVRPEIRAAQQHDDASRTRAGVQESVAEPGALGCAHGSIVEIEGKIANISFLRIDNLAERAVIGGRIDGQRCLGHAAKQWPQHLRRRQFDPGGGIEHTIRRLLGLQMGDPDGAIDGADADRAIAPGQNLAGRSLQTIFLVGSIKETVLAEQQRGEDARGAVGRTDLAHDRRCFVARPIDGPVGLPHRRPQTAACPWRRIGQRFRLPGAGLVLPRFDPCDRLENAAQGRPGDLITIKAAFRDGIARKRKFMRGPNIASIEVRRRLKNRHAPMLFAVGNGPVERGRTPIPLDAGMHDQAEMAGPDFFWNCDLQHRRKDQIRRFAGDSLGHGLRRRRDADADIVAAITKLDPKTLAEAVMGRGQKKNSHCFAPWIFRRPAMI